MRGLTRREALGRLASLVAAPALGRSVQRSMIARKIPVSGEALPVIGLGTWQTFDVSGARALDGLYPVLQGFAELGGSVIDSSPMYGRSEEVTGELVKRAGAHDRFFIATKVWTRGERAGSEQMQESLKYLGTVQLMQVHNLVDADTHLRTLARWKAEGRIRSARPSGRCCRLRPSIGQPC